MPQNRATTETLHGLCKELDCTSIYGVGGKQGRAFQRKAHTILTLVLADDYMGTNARLKPGIYSRHKEEWRQCCFPDKRQPNLKPDGLVLGIAVF